MKIKKLHVFALVGVLTLASCQKDPQKSAQREADHQQKMADNAVENSASAADASVANAESAVAHQTAADVNQAIANVPVPKFEKLAANEMAKKIGNHINEFVNANNLQETGKFADKLSADKAELEKQVSKNVISKEDGAAIEAYVGEIAKAVGVTIE